MHEKQSCCWVLLVTRASNHCHRLDCVSHQSPSLPPRAPTPPPQLVSSSHCHPTPCPSLGLLPSPPHAHSGVFAHEFTLTCSLSHTHRREFTLTCSLSHTHMLTVTPLHTCSHTHTTWPQTHVLTHTPARVHTLLTYATCFAVITTRR